MDNNTPLKTPLYSLSAKAKAKFTEFAGWEMPLQYISLKQEHQAVRDSVGMFDISHMGKFTVKGQNLRKTIQQLVPSDLSQLQNGKALYTVLLNEQAGIIDDIIIYYQGQDNQGIESAVIIVNASTTAKDWAWLNKYLDNSLIELQDQSKDYGLIALQGKKAVDYLSPLISADLSNLGGFCHLTTTIDDETVFIARTGYTGEDGFEIMSSPSMTQKLWQNWQEKGVTLCGLGARDTLRLEAAMCLYGQDMNDETTPLEAGLGWVVNLDGDFDFIGKNVLKKQKEEGLNKRLVALEMQGKYIARHGYPIVYQNEVIGEVTSGTLSPTLNQAIALGYVTDNLSKIGQQLEVEIRGKFYPAKVVKKPFYRGSAKRK
jgi:aminomethyltransferase